MSFIQGRIIYELGEDSTLLAVKSLLWGLAQEFQEVRPGNKETGPDWLEGWSGDFLEVEQVLLSRVRGAWERWAGGLWLVPGRLPWWMFPVSATNSGLNLWCGPQGQPQFCSNQYRKWACQVALVVKNPPANARDLKDVGSFPGLGRTPGEENGNPIFLPGKSHGQRNLVGYGL